MNCCLWHLKLLFLFRSLCNSRINTRSYLDSESCVWCSIIGRKSLTASKITIHCTDVGSPFYDTIILSPLLNVNGKFNSWISLTFQYLTWQHHLSLIIIFDMFLGNFGVEVSYRDIKSIMQQLFVPTCIFYTCIYLRVSDR